MFNDYLRNTKANYYRYQLIPSTSHFSLLVNRLNVTAASFGVLAVACFTSVFFGAWGFLTGGITIICGIVFIVQFVRGFSMNKIQAESVIKVEKAFNEMSKSYRKQYARFLTACYQDPDNFRLRTDAIALFEIHTEKIEKPNIGEELKEALDAVRNARSLAEEIYNSSLRNRNV